MRTQMPFGTRTHVGWIPCPTSGFEHTISRKSVINDRVDGPPGYYTSKQPIKSFNFNWTDPNIDLNLVRDAFDYAGGPPYYFTNPKALTDPTYNLLPPQWAAPGMFIAKHGKSAAKGTYALISETLGYIAPQSVLTGLAVNEATGLLPRSAAFTIAKRDAYTEADDKVFDGGAAAYRMIAATAANNYRTYSMRNPSASVLVPPGYTVAVYAYGKGTNFGLITGVQAAIAGTGDFASEVTTGVLRQSFPAAYGQVSWSQAVAQWSRVDIAFGAADTTLDASGEVVSTACLIKKGATPPFVWSRGRGQMALFPTTDLTVTTYQAYDPELTSMATTLSEGLIAW